MQLIQYLDISGKIVCETGLLIGSNKPSGIGGIDKFMIKESYNGNKPYIPGSSLKGKMRHLIELRDTIIKSEDPHFCSEEDCHVCRVFGIGAGKTTNVIGPTRLIVRDAKLNITDEVKEFLRQSGSFTETKTENVINRVYGSAVPRTFERVPAGMEFVLDMTYRVLDDVVNSGENREYIDQNFFHYVLEALWLVQGDYLGASGSRGYGKVRFKDIKVTRRDIKDGTENKVIEMSDLCLGSISEECKKVMTTPPSPQEKPSEQTDKEMEEE